jgi:hypothetical protein
MATQTSYTKHPAVALEGQEADMMDVRDVVSRLVNDSAGLVPGLAAIRAAADSDGEVSPMENPASTGDADAYSTSKSSPTGGTTYDGSQLDGVLGDTEQPFGYQVDFILDNNADWDNTTATLVGKRASDGAIVSESLDIPDSGNTTLTSTNFYSRVISLTIPAQSGTGGSWTLGTNSASPVFSRPYAMGVTMLRVARESRTYADNEYAPLMRQGRIYVKVEDAVSEGQRAYCRHTAPGSETLGAFRGDDDSGNAAAYFARFAHDAAAGDLVPLEVDVPGAAAA